MKKYIIELPNDLKPTDLIGETETYINIIMGNAKEVVEVTADACPNNITIEDAEHNCYEEGVTLYTEKKR